MLPDRPDDLVALGRNGEGGGIVEGGPEVGALLALRHRLLQPFLEAGELLKKPGAAPAALTEVVEPPADRRPVPQHRPGQENANPSSYFCGLTSLSCWCCHSLKKNPSAPYYIH